MRRQTYPTSIYSLVLSFFLVWTFPPFFYLIFFMSDLQRPVGPHQCLLLFNCRWFLCFIRRLHHSEGLTLNFYGDVIFLYPLLPTFLFPPIQVSLPHFLLTSPSFPKLSIFPIDLNVSFNFFYIFFFSNSGLLPRVWIQTWKILLKHTIGYCTTSIFFLELTNDTARCVFFIQILRVSITPVLQSWTLKVNNVQRFAYFLVV